MKCVNSSRIAYPPSSWIDDYFDWLARGSGCCRQFETNSSFCPSAGDMELISKIRKWLRAEIFRSDIFI